MRHIFFLGFLLLHPFNAVAEDKPKFKTLTLGATNVTAPYLYENRGKIAGLEYQIAKEALQNQKLKLEVKIFPNQHRADIEFEHGRVDGIFTRDASHLKKGVFLTNHFITYNNYAITQNSRNLSFKNLADLKGASVAAFSNAKFVLGKKFAAATKTFRNYTEIPENASRILFLSFGRADVIISDCNIFSHSLNKNVLLSRYKNASFKLQFKMTETPYGILLNNKKIRDTFNRGLKNLKKSGRLQELKKSFVQCRLSKK